MPLKRDRQTETHRERLLTTSLATYIYTLYLLMALNLNQSITRFAIKKMEKCKF